jgi:hypothetical protein
VVFMVVLCLVLALAGIAGAAFAILRARAAEERARQAAVAVGRAESAAHAARLGIEQLEAQLTQAHRDADEANQHATRAAQAAAQASASAAAARREAEEASDRATRSETEAHAARDAAEQAHRVADEAAAGARAAGDVANTAAAQAASIAPPTGAILVVDPSRVPLGPTADHPTTAGAPSDGARATVYRAEDRSVSGRNSGETERVVQVSWQLEQVRGSIWALRNTGMIVARGALLSEATLPPKYVRPDEVIPRDVHSGDVLQFRVTAGRGAPPPRIRVTWREGSASPAYSREFTVLAAG